MGQVLHGSATTTEAVRRAIQHSQASLRALAKRYGINQKTVAKWKGRTSVADVPTGPKEPKSTVLDGMGAKACKAELSSAGRPTQRRSRAAPTSPTLRSKRPSPPFRARISLVRLRGGSAPAPLA